MAKQKTKKFRQTRQLVKLALQDGWTQKKIADTCRTQQSIVSAWARGEKYATELQLKPLLEIYGGKIKRKSFRVYYSFDSESNKHQYYKVEGNIVFSYTFTEKYNVGRGIKELPIYKIVVHHQGDNKFRVVFQNRPRFTNPEEYLQCSYSSGIWFSEISEIFNSKETIRNIEKYIEKYLNQFKSEQITIPYLIRKSLIERGFSVEGIVDYPATW